MYMRFFVLACLLPLAGCQFQSSLTTITNATIDGRGVNATRSWIGEGSGEFDCVKSVSGQCHYVLYTEGCRRSRPAGKASDGDKNGHPDTPRCEPRVFATFTLKAGMSRRLGNLPPGLHQCVRHDSAPGVGDCLAAET